jgi:uncharacterized protein YbaR (Trm112 family)
MNAWLLEIIKCPLSNEKLRPAEPAVVERLAAKQRAGQLFSHKGLQLEEPFESGLVNESSTFFYRISDGIPTLLPDEAISIEAAPGAS